MTIKPGLKAIIFSIAVIFSLKAESYRPHYDLKKYYELQKQYENWYESDSSSPFHWLEKAYSYSSTEDSDRVAYCLQKVPIYYFVARWHSSERPDTMLNLYGLKRSDRDSFISRYISVLFQRKSADYSTFKKMVEESEAIEKELSAEIDNERRKALCLRRWETDQQHFRYLYNYVQSQGWPSFENGAEYAIDIAQKDDSNRDYYISLLAEPKSKRSISLNGMRLLLGPFYIYDMESVRYALGTKSYSSYVFHIDKNAELPKESDIENLRKIIADKDQKVKEIYFAFAAPKESDIMEWNNSDQAGKGKTIERLQKALSPENNSSVFAQGDQSIVYVPCDTKELIVVFKH